MTPEETETMELPEAPEKDRLWKNHPWAMTYILCAGLLVPILCFAASHWLGDALEPEWQSGELHDLPQMMLAGRLWPFYPLVLYSMTCLALAMFSTSMSRKSAIRFGLFSGILLCGFFIVIILAGHGIIAARIFLFGTLGACGICGGIYIAVKLTQALSRRLRWPTAIIAVAAFLALSLLIRATWQWVLMAPIGAGPVLTGAAFLWFIWLRAFPDESRHPSLWFGLLPLTWVGVFYLAMQKSAAISLEAYAKLPTEPPDCYVCSAAANGHARFVGAQKISLPSGEVMRVNRQMQRLKSTELWLAERCPRLHGRLRHMYDRLGPPLAHIIARRPLLADLAYLTLKPAEIFAVLLLRK